jgi:hypothetical protein
MKARVYEGLMRAVINMNTGLNSYTKHMKKNHIRAFSRLIKSLPTKDLPHEWQKARE